MVFIVVFCTGDKIVRKRRGTERIPDLKERGREGSRARERRNV